MVARIHKLVIKPNTGYFSAPTAVVSPNKASLDGDGVTARFCGAPQYPMGAVGHPSRVNHDARVATTSTLVASKAAGRNVSDVLRMPVPSALHFSIAAKHTATAVTLSGMGGCEVGEHLHRGQCGLWQQHARKHLQFSVPRPHICAGLSRTLVRQLPSAVVQMALPLVSCKTCATCTAPHLDCPIQTKDLGGHWRYATGHVYKKT